ncbi:MAG TPA: divalent-cation tolerance protein CutA [Candidatus Binataceae bacterium]|nr:divalent-cation tolerance protein CutA [Candidatus Binataceae bacterium]
MAARNAAPATIVFITVASEQQAEAIARALVGERLAACVNVVGPIRSIYRWQDAVEDEREFLLLAKTRANLFARLERRVRELHPYEVPEIIAVRLDAGSAPYLAWLLESTASEAAPRPASTRRPKRATVHRGPARKR